jgi:hypothetical protein
MHLLPQCPEAKAAGRISGRKAGLRLERERIKSMSTGTLALVLTWVDDTQTDVLFSPSGHGLHSAFYFPQS